MEKLVEVCLELASISVIVDGSPTSEFPMSKGLGQCNLMAPFLFLLVAEGINGLINEESRSTKLL